MFGEWGLPSIVIPWLKKKISGTPPWIAKIYSNPYFSHISRYFKGKSHGFLSIFPPFARGWDSLTPWDPEDWRPWRSPFPWPPPTWRDPIKVGNTPGQVTWVNIWGVSIHHGIYIYMWNHDESWLVGFFHVLSIRVYLSSDDREKKTYRREVALGLLRDAYSMRVKSRLLSLSNKKPHFGENRFLLTNNGK